MISWVPPSEGDVFRRMHALSDAPYSYAEVAATRGVLPPGYNVDRYSGVVGQGPSAFEAAKAAIRSWTPFRLPWMRVIARGEPEPGCLVAVVARVVTLWWTNVSRVVYTIDEPGRFGFAYGTLHRHAERGEERFLVELDPSTGRVRYSVLAFSRPRHVLAKLGYPLSRAAQRRFGAQTVEAMRREVSGLQASRRGAG